MSLLPDCEGISGVITTKNLKNKVQPIFGLIISPNPLRLLYKVQDKISELDDFILLEYITFNTNKDYYNIIHDNVNNIVNYIKNIQFI